MSSPKNQGEGQSQLNVGERLYQKGRKKQEEQERRRKEMQEEIEKKIEKELSFHPKLVPNQFHTTQ